MLASTLIPQPQSMIHAPLEEDVNMSFGRFIHKFVLHYSCDYQMHLFFGYLCRRWVENWNSMKFLFNQLTYSIFWWMIISELHFSGSMLLRSLTLSENDGDLEVIYVLISKKCWNIWYDASVCITKYHKFSDVP